MKENIGERWLNIYRTQLEDQKGHFLTHLERALHISDMFSNTAMLRKEFLSKKAVPISYDGTGNTEYHFEDIMTGSFGREYFRIKKNELPCYQLITVMRSSMIPVFMAVLNHLPYNDMIFIAWQTYVSPLGILASLVELPTESHNRLHNRWLLTHDLDKSPNITNRDQLILFKHRDRCLFVVSAVISVIQAHNGYSRPAEDELIKLVVSQTKAFLYLR